jgi:uncharacterized protein (TIGR02284 family)
VRSASAGKFLESADSVGEEKYGRSVIAVFSDSSGDALDVELHLRLASLIHEVADKRRNIMGVDIDRTISILNDLITTLRDSQESFRNAAQSAKNSDLKFMLMEFSTQRAGFLGELQNEIERLGDPAPEDSGSIAGSVRRGWMKLKSALLSDHDQTLINECERGDDVVIEAYSKALAKEMPRYIRDILERQLAEIGVVRAEISQMKERSAHA